MIKACIFDLDGVIVNTAVYHFKAWKRLANELGFDLDEQFNENLKGLSRKESLEALLKHGNVQLDEAQKKEVSDLKNSWYQEFIAEMDESEILPGVVDFIHDLKKHNIKISIGSSSKNARFVMDRIKLAPIFDAHVDGSDITKAKPNPEIFLKGAEALGVSPEECVVFEDAEKGVEAALAAGMIAIGIGTSSKLSIAHFQMASFEGFTAETLFEQTQNVKNTQA